MLRHNDTVYTVWPAKRLVVIEQRDPIAIPSARSCRQPSRIDGFYELRRAEALDPRRPGRDADLLSLLRLRDKLLSATASGPTRATGLLLRVEVLGDQGEVLESSPFPR